MLLPQQCFRVEVVVHQDPQMLVYALAFEVSDPHTKELLAKWVDPCVPRSVSLPVATAVSTALRGVLAALTDPEPF